MSLFLKPLRSIFPSCLTGWLTPSTQGKKYCLASEKRLTKTDEIEQQFRDLEVIARNRQGNYTLHSEN